MLFLTGLPTRRSKYDIVYIALPTGTNKYGIIIHSVANTKNHILVDSGQYYILYTKKKHTITDS